MSAIYDKVKDMSRSDKMAYFKTITKEEKKAYDNYMNYQRVLKSRNNDRAKYNEYMKEVKNRSRKANPQLYRLQNNRDVANYRARKTLTPDAASKVITSNLKNYIEKLKAIKQGNEDTVYKKLAANAVGSKLIDSLITDAIKSQPERRRGRPRKQ
jgi:type I site-specific restriction-modification system R (restriction) subunit